MTEIGDIVKGFGSKSKSMTDILVDRISPVENFVSGRVIMAGRLTNRRDTIMMKARYDVLTSTHIQNNWEPSDAAITFRQSLSASIKKMEVEDVIDIEKQDFNIDTCRSIAARIAVNEGRRYTVNRTPEGCTITRKA